jgi:hypothetical protein
LLAKLAIVNRRFTVPILEDEIILYQIRWKTDGQWTYRVTHDETIARGVFHNWCAILANLTSVTIPVQLCKLHKGELHVLESNHA